MKRDYYISKYVRPFFQNYLVHQRNMSEDSIKSYRDAVKLFLRFTSTKLKKPTVSILVTDLKKTIVIDFLAHLENNRGNKIQTRNQRLSILRTLFTYIALEEPVLNEHCRRVIAIPFKQGATSPEIKYLEKEEIAALFNATDKSTMLGRRDYAILLFMYNTGARVRETVDVRRSQISFNRPYKVEILGKGKKWRTCPLWKDTTKILQKLLAETKMPYEDSQIFLNRFGRPFSRFGILKIIAKYKDKASLEVKSLETKNITPHTIRHTTAMHLLQSGVDINVIRSWLGHVDLRTTHCYAEIDLTMKRKALETCEIKSKKSSPARWHNNPEILTWLESL